MQVRVAHARQHRLAGKVDHFRGIKACQSRFRRPDENDLAVADG